MPRPTQTSSYVSLLSAGPGLYPFFVIIDRAFLSSVSQSSELSNLRGDMGTPRLYSWSGSVGGPGNPVLAADVW